MHGKERFFGKRKYFCFLRSTSVYLLSVAFLFYLFLFFKSILPRGCLIIAFTKRAVFISKVKVFLGGQRSIRFYGTSAIVCPVVIVIVNYKSSDDDNNNMMM